MWAWVRSLVRAWGVADRTLKRDWHETSPPESEIQTRQYPGSGQNTNMSAEPWVAVVLLYCYPCERYKNISLNRHYGRKHVECVVRTDWAYRLNVTSSRTKRKKERSTERMGRGTVPRKGCLVLLVSQASAVKRTWSGPSSCYCSIIGNRARRMDVSL
jgi:hypothetical protein